MSMHNKLDYSIVREKSLTPNFFFLSLRKDKRLEDLIFQKSQESQ